MPADQPTSSDIFSMPGEGGGCGLPPASTGNGPRAKRIQVKNACGNCKKACKKCEDVRPCPRCVSRGMADSCTDSERKRRVAGVQRGPYKKRGKLDALDDVKTETPSRADPRGIGDLTWLDEPIPPTHQSNTLFSSTIASPSYNNMFYLQTTRPFSSRIPPYLGVIAPHNAQGLVPHSTPHMSPMLHLTAPTANTLNTTPTTAHSALLASTNSRPPLSLVTMIQQQQPQLQVPTQIQIQHQKQHQQLVSTPVQSQSQPQTQQQQQPLSALSALCILSDLALDAASENASLLKVKEVEQDFGIDLSAFAVVSSSPSRPDEKCDLESLQKDDEMSVSSRSTDGDIKIVKTSVVTGDNLSVTQEMTPIQSPDRGMSEDMSTNLNFV